MSALTIDNIAKKMRELIIPELQDIKTDNKVIQSEIKRLDDKITSLEGGINNFVKSSDTRFNVLEREIVNLRDDIKSIRSEIYNVRDDVKSLRAEFHLAIDIHERLATLEAKIGH